MSQVEQNAKTKAKAKKQSADLNSEEGSARANSRNAARMALSPSLNAVAVIEKYGKPLGELDLATLLESLNDSIAKVWDGDLKQCEAMLLGQAHALQAIFMNLARRAATQEYLPQYETHLRIALKAQSQCRATLETLAEIKSPRQIAFVQQANIANGPQQVNNRCQPHPAAQTHAREEKRIQSNELLKDASRETEIIGMDTGATRSPSRTDPQLEAVGAVNGAKHGSRQGHQQP